MVPVLDFKSPIAYALVLEIHLYHPYILHAGVETVVRYTQTVACILNGRYLVKDRGKYCIWCRIENYALMNILMGPLGLSGLQLNLYVNWSSYIGLRRPVSMKYSSKINLVTLLILLLLTDECFGSNPFMDYY